MRQNFLALLLLFASFDVRAAVTGRVLDEEGKPIAGARVRISALETTEQARLRMLSKHPQRVALATAETSASGAFRLDPKGHPVVDLIVEAPEREFAATAVVDKDDLTFVLGKRPPRRGRVTAAGRGVAGATLFLGWHVAKTDAEGRYELPGGSLGRLIVIHPDYAIADGSLRTTERFELSFDVKLQATPALRGRVTDTSGKPVSGAVVYAAGWPVTSSAEDGSFEIVHAPADRSAITARDTKRVGSLNAQNVISLRPAASIFGTVRSNKDDMPVPGMRIMFREVTAAISDSKGNFTIDGLLPGETHLAAWNPAFAASASQMQIEEGARANLVLMATPFGRLTGRVVDEKQQPVAGARLTTLGSGLSIATALDGSFSLRIPPAGTYPISVVKAPYSAASHGPFTVQPGETKNVEIRLERGFPFEVRLTDQDGVPIADEVVLLSRVTDAARRYEMIACNSGDVMSCRTDAEGRLAFTLAEGTYNVFAGGLVAMRKEIPNQTIEARLSPLTIKIDRGATIEGRTVWSDGTPARINGMVRTTSMRPSETAQVTDGAFTVRVPPGKVSLIVEGRPPLSLRSDPIEVTAPASGVALMLPRPGRITGRVVARDSGEPVHDFAISATTRGSHMSRGGERQNLHTEDGRFTLEDVSPGDYEVRVIAAGYAAGSTRVAVEEGAIADAAEIALEPGGTLAGRVTSSGRPVPDAQVSVEWHRGSMSSSSGMRTDANGEFRVHGLSLGAHRIEVKREGFVTARIPVDVTAGGETRADVEMSRGREVRGRVIDASGRPVSNASVSAPDYGPTGGSYSGGPNTDADGSFRLSGLGEKAQIIARKEGFVEARLDVNPAVTSEVTITLERGGSISGRVLGIAPDQLPFVDVSAFGGGGTHARTRPDATGTFTLTGVANGDITVTAATRGLKRREARAKVQMVNDVAPPVDLDFNAGIGIRGRVTLRGRPVEGHIRFERQGVRESMSAQIEADGTYETRLPTEGEYGVTVMRQWGRGMTAAGNVEVRGDMVHDIDLRGATVTGVVVDAETRAPLSNATVGLASAGEQITNSAGRFTFEVVPDGEYSVHVQRNGFAPLVREISIRNGVATEMEFPLSRGVPVTVRVVDQTTGELVDAAVFVFDGGKLPIYTSQPEGRGERTFSLHAGTYRLSVVSSTHQQADVRLTVPGPPVEVKVARRASR